MFTHYRTEGLILEKIDRGEADRIFTIYTKEFGKLELLAKAERKIKSKLRAGLENFYVSDIEFIQAKTHKTLTDAILIEKFENLRKDLKKLRIVYKISEIFLVLIKGQEPDKNIWQLLTETFEKLNHWQIENSLKIGNCKLEILYYYFLWNLLSILGYQPELYHCSLCHKKIVPENIFFNPKEGGLICNQCQKSMPAKNPIDVDTVKIIRILLNKDWLTLKKLKVNSSNFKQLQIISDYYLSAILEQI